MIYRLLVPLALISVAFGVGCAFDIDPTTGQEEEFTHLPFDDEERNTILIKPEKLDPTSPRLWDGTMVWLPAVPATQAPDNDVIEQFIASFDNTGSEPTANTSLLLNHDEVHVYEAFAGGESVYRCAVPRHFTPAELLQFEGDLFGVPTCEIELIDITSLNTSDSAPTLDEWVAEFPDWRIPLVEVEEIDPNTNESFTRQYVGAYTYTIPLRQPYIDPNGALYTFVRARNEFYWSYSLVHRVGTLRGCDSQVCDLTGAQGSSFGELDGPNQLYIDTKPASLSEGFWQPWSPINLSPNTGVEPPATFSKIEWSSCQVGQFGVASVYLNGPGGTGFDDGGSGAANYELWFNTLSETGDWGDGPFQIAGNDSSWAAQSSPGIIGSAAGTPMMPSQLVWMPDLERWAISVGYFGDPNGSAANFRGTIRAFKSDDTLGTSWSPRVLYSGANLAAEVRMAYSPVLSDEDGFPGVLGLVWEGFEGNQPDMFFRFLSANDLSDIGNFGSFGLRISDKLAGQDVVRNDSPDIAAFEHGFIVAWQATSPDWPCLNQVFGGACPPPPGIQPMKDLGVRLFIGDRNVGYCDGISQNCRFPRGADIEIDQGPWNFPPNDDPLEQGNVQRYVAPSIAVSSFDTDNDGRPDSEYAGVIWQKLESTDQFVSSIQLYIIDLTDINGGPDPDSDNIRGLAGADGFGTVVNVIELDRDENRGLNRAWPEIDAFANGFAVTWWNDNADCFERLRGSLVSWNAAPLTAPDGRRDLSYLVGTQDTAPWTNPLTGVNCPDGKSHHPAPFGHPHSITVTECPTLAVAEGRAFAQESLSG